MEANENAFAHGYEDGLGPYVASYSKGTWYATDGFKAMVNSSHLAKKFKWTLNTRGDLGVVNPQLKHSAASGGGEIWTAGHGWKSGKDKNGKDEITLDNDTGHYQVSEASLSRAVKAWEELGYSVKTQAFKDPMAAMKKLF